MNNTPGHNLLVTLLCPNRRCLKRVAVMSYFPFSTRVIKPGDITLIDGRTAPNPDKLVCRHCFTTFPARKAAIPDYLMQAAKGDLQKEYERALQADNALPATS